MTKVPFSRRYPRSRGFIPQQGYRHVMAQCKGCLKLWNNVGVRFNTNKNEYIFDFDNRCEIMGEVEFDDQNETITCKTCGGKVNLYRWIQGETNVFQ